MTTFAEKPNMTDNITHNRSSATAEPPRTGTEAFATGEGTQSDARTIGYDSANLKRSRRFEPELDGTRQPIAAPNNRKNRKKHTTRRDMECPYT